MEKTRINAKVLQHYLKQAYNNGTIKCPVCFDLLEPDMKKCLCGWENPLPKFGLI